MPESPHGFLAQAVSYARHRIPTCCEFCVICDKPHVFASGAMLKASVCSRDLCGFAFQQLGVGADSATDIATEAGVVDLLLVMAKMAASSPRWDLIFSPYPTVFDPSNPERKVVDPERKDIEFVKKIFQAFPKIRDLNQTEDAIDMKKRMDTSNPWAHPLLTWIINSNLSHLIKMRDDGDTKRTVAAMRTPHQYLLLSAAPEKQKIFDAMKAKSKTMFAFHGSSIENWHSILRNGLYNASGTKHQVNGAAHGAGIYLSPDSQVSFGYSNLGTARSSRGGDGGAHGERYIEEGTDMRCVAICEVCEQDLRKSGQIWVQPNADYVVTRFLFVYDRHHKPERCPTTEDKEFISQLEQVIAHYAV